jgi:hypothetical protein
MLAARRRRDPVCAFRGCAAETTDGHEILTRARGGSISDAANVLLLCRSHHEMVTVNPAWADGHGWTVASWAGGAAGLARAAALRDRWPCWLDCNRDHRVS